MLCFYLEAINNIKIQYVENSIDEQIKRLENENKELNAKIELF